MSIYRYTPNGDYRDASNNYIYGAPVRNNPRSQSITVGLTAVALPTTPLTNRSRLLIQNLSNNMVYIGGSDVTTSNGFKLLPMAALDYPIDDNFTIYATSDGASSDVRIVEG